MGKQVLWRRLDKVQVHTVLDRVSIFDEMQTGNISTPAYLYSAGIPNGYGGVVEEVSERDSAWMYAICDRERESDEPYSSRSTPLLYWDVWKGGNKFELHTPSVDWSTESSLLCDRGIITNKHSTSEVFLDNDKSLIYWRNCRTKVWRPSWTHCCSLFSVSHSSFSLDLLAGLHWVSGCYEVTMLTWLPWLSLSDLNPALP